MPDTAVLDGLVTHDIYAGNQLIGEGLLFRLRLPPEWQIAPGVSHPEVASMHERARKTWVVSGDAWYVIYNEEQKWAMELAVRLSLLGNKPLAVEKNGAESVVIAGHAAQVTWRTGRRGPPWRRREVRFLTVKFDCPQSERRLSLELSGRCDPAGFDQVLAALAHLGCH